MGPSGWVFNYDFIFEILFALITLGIGFFALKIYSYSRQRQLKNFGLSFLSISVSFFILAAMNVGLIEIVRQMLPITLELQGLMRLVLASHMSFYIIGMITLAYSTLKIHSEQTYYILILTTFLAIIAATHKLYLFYSIASILLACVFIHYYRSYNRKKQVKNLPVMVGFGFLFLANIALIFSVGNTFYYIAGHVLELIGYCLLFINLARVMK